MCSALFTTEISIPHSALGNILIHSVIRSMKIDCTEMLTYKVGFRVLKRTHKHCIHFIALLLEFL
jgi:hypothetical protein